ncbi:MAG: hypothetical protein RL037_699 [Bacteroidota bacterium]|jgi:SAM-dependent methyltransferase
MAEKEWFSTWFDTSYYHVLYRHRNDEEAATFIKHLINKLNLPKNSSVLDLACGKGRHSVMLHQAGFDVLGVDLSKNSISLAKQNEEDKLSFEVHDMRETMANKQFDAVFNLFTSFGYFDNSNENKKVVDAVHKMLDEKGLFVIDFMNAHKVLKNLVAFEEKIHDGIHFSINKKCDGQHIFKYIDVIDKGENHHFMERVQYLVLEDFQQLFEGKFTIQHVFGDYQLNTFDEVYSDRLILIAEKNTWN